MHRVLLLTMAFSWLCAGVAARGEDAATAQEKSIGKLEKKVQAVKKKISLKLPLDSRSSFESSGELPAEPEGLAAVSGSLTELEGVLDSVARLRDPLKKKGVTAIDPRLKRLADLESEINKIVGSSDRFMAGAIWSGVLEMPDGAHKIELDIKEGNGRQFAGELKERTRVGSPIVMQIEGERKGTSLIMKTGAMIQGQNRAHEFEGGVYRNQILADSMSYDQVKVRRQVGVQAKSGKLNLTFGPPGKGKGK